MLFSGSLSLAGHTGSRPVCGRRRAQLSWGAPARREHICRARARRLGSSVSKPVHSSRYRARSAVGSTATATSVNRLGTRPNRRCGTAFDCETNSVNTRSHAFSARATTGPALRTALIALGYSKMKAPSGSGFSAHSIFAAQYAPKPAANSASALNTEPETFARAAARAARAAAKAASPARSVARAVNVSSSARFARAAACAARAARRAARDGFAAFAASAARAAAWADRITASTNSCISSRGPAPSEDVTAAPCPSRRTGSQERWRCAAP